MIATKLTIRHPQLLRCSHRSDIYVFSVATQRRFERAEGITGASTPGYGLGKGGELRRNTFSGGNATYILLPRHAL